MVSLTRKNDSQQDLEDEHSLGLSEPTSAILTILLEETLPWKSCLMCAIKTCTVFTASRGQAGAQREYFSGLILLSILVTGDKTGCFPF